MEELIETQQALIKAQDEHINSLKKVVELQIDVIRKQEELLNLYNK